MIATVMSNSTAEIMLINQAFYLAWFPLLDRDLLRLARNHD
jgi:hypothetical protein